MKKSLKVWFGDGFKRKCFLEGGLISNMGFGNILKKRGLKRKGRRKNRGGL